jgi:hypothetical protein
MPFDGVPPSFHNPRIPHEPRDWLPLCALAVVTIIASIGAALVLGTWAGQFCCSSPAFSYQPPYAPIR